MLTTRQNKSWNISARVSINSAIPIGTGICKEVGLSSTSTVHGYLHRLEDLGYIRRDPAKNRTIELLDEGSWRSKKVVPLPLVGQSGRVRRFLLKNVSKTSIPSRRTSSAMTTASCSSSKGTA